MTAAASVHIRTRLNLQHTTVDLSLSRNILGNLNIRQLRHVSFCNKSCQERLFLANVNSRSRLLCAVARPYVCRLSNARAPYSAG